MSVQNKALSQGLAKLLADSYVVFLQTQNYHWNVTGPMFFGLHSMFEEQYTELFEAIDEIAERIRSLGEVAPGTMADFIKLTSIKEGNAISSAQEMIAELLESQEALVETAKAVIPLAEEADDEVSLDLAIGRMAVHEKTAWMLRSLAA